MINLGNNKVKVYVGPNKIGSAYLNGNQLISQEKGRPNYFEVEINGGSNPSKTYNVFIYGTTQDGAPEPSVPFDIYRDNQYIATYSTLGSGTPYPLEVLVGVHTYKFVPQGEVGNYRINVYNGNLKKQYLLGASDNYQITRINLPHGWCSATTVNGAFITELWIPNTIQTLVYSYESSTVAVPGIDQNSEINCPYLKTIEFENNEDATQGMYIRGKSFMNCTQVTKIILPRKIQRMFTASFYNLSALQEVIYPGTMAEYEAIVRNNYSGNNPKSLYKGPFMDPIGTGGDMSPLLNQITCSDGVLTW